MTIRAPPVVRVGAAFVAGLAPTQLAEVPSPLPIVLTALALLALPYALPVRPFRRKGAGAAGLLVTAVAGVLAGSFSARERARDCRLHLPDGARLRVRGTFESIPDEGRLVPFLLEGGEPGTCRGRVRAAVRGSGRASLVTAPDPGDEVVVWGSWYRTARLGHRRTAPERSGYLAVDSVGLLAPGGVRHRPLLTLRGRFQRSLRRLFPERAAVAEALLLARREGLDPSLRESFARAGVAHLLAISGFHVGIVAALLSGALVALGSRPAGARSGALAGSWAYVLWIGAPWPAVRAAAILTALLAARLVGRPAVPLGSLTTAGLILLFLDPAALRDVGFQLSFAGAGGIAVLAPRLEPWLARGLTRALPPGDSVSRVRRWLLRAGAAGVAATLATAPLTAWHFSRISLLGIPLTLALAPWVGVVIPGLAASVVAGVVGEGLARFLAGGADLCLALGLILVKGAAALPGASIHVSRTGVVVAGAGVAVALVVVALLPPVSAGVRRILLVVGAGSALTLWPALARWSGDGDLHLYFLDVGQGDALAIRSPLGRWVLVDAGPRSRGYDAGRSRVVPFFRRRGVGRLSALILTHPDLDHVGGAGSVVDAVPTASIMDPGRAVGKPVYLDLLRLGRDEEVQWVEGRVGRRMELDGAVLEVLHPPRGPLDRGEDANDYSIVLWVGYGAFSALLTGDAPAGRELEAVSRLPDPDVRLLKVGHHGSGTSTAEELLDRARPEVAVISVGRRNRYGHPAPSVLARLTARGIRILRTDVDGTIHVVAEPDGGVRIETGMERPGVRQ